MSGTTGDRSTEDVEAEVLRRLAEVGLLVPTREPNRPHTKTEERCWKVGLAGFRASGGSSFHGRFPCNSRGCEACAFKWADQEMAEFRREHPDFVGVSPIAKENLVYRACADKLPPGALWVTSATTPPESVSLLKDRLATRCKRLRVKGQPVEYVVIPCDGAVIIVATADLTEGKAQGRPLVAPTSGQWLEGAVADLFFHRVLSSTAVCGRIFWSAAWKPKEEKSERKVYVIAGPPRITQTAHQILFSEGYVFTASGPSWTSEDPVDVLFEAKRRAERFWEDPRCSACSVAIGVEDHHGWHDGQVRCGPCDLALDLADFLTRGRTEREIEAHLRRRKIAFKRKRGLIEEALSRAGAEKMASGIWVRRTVEEDAA